ncbi:MAG: phosphoribosylanthranilate isomerase [Candidatus Dormibacteraeota bacterium]|nr:phosphoribosylanthranilate isomerase [Candidatus Dormibacteraeota bacterium]
MCGVRSAAIAEVAVQSGADWIGLVLEPRSVRFADDDAACAVVNAVHGRAGVVGVFVSPTPEQTNSAVDRYHLAAVQVHGECDPGFAEASSVPVIRGLNIRGVADVLADAWWPDCLLLLDSAPDPDGLPGGTGKRLHPGLAAQIAAHRQIILAGGLGPNDVADVIARVHPHGVDASSALEVAPGEKDSALVAAFVQAARAAA